MTETQLAKSAPFGETFDLLEDKAARIEPLRFILIAVVAKYCEFLSFEQLKRLLLLMPDALNIAQESARAVGTGGDVKWFEVPKDALELRLYCDVEKLIRSFLEQEGSEDHKNKPLY